MIIEKVFFLRLCRKSREKVLIELLDRRYLTFQCQCFHLLLSAKISCSLIKLRLFQILEQYTPNVGKYELLGIVFR